ncbi:aminotransferase class III [Lujinxingia litoralis]|uniref:Aminotransferase class III n=1 Tax=Lujinxingia litoralis TaxID=2211119 RepID=A0A328C204_9DELT|nr:aminotransferase class III-fold pyridoxal phosphate-dependent enzyme [Lujinxingia litoralis]RAL20672.1 aminotransferase class III [Lujinxingia litoralis]
MSPLSSAPTAPAPSSSAALLNELNTYVLAEPHPFVVDLARSEGMYLATLEGDRLFDWAGYYGAKLIAHNHPGLYEAEYTRRLVVAANNKIANPDFLTPECLEYYRTLHQLGPQCMQNPGLEVYAVNSGAEAVENMMKYLINLHHQRLLSEGKTPRARRFVYFDQAFHGRTVFALNVTRVSHDPVMTKDFQGLIPGNLQVPFPALDTTESEAETREKVARCLTILENLFEHYRDEIVAVILEPIQGAGGHRVAPRSFFQQLSELCHTHQIPLAFDEVQTAGGATGTFFTIDGFDLPHPPQAVASGKKLGNGVVYMLNRMDDLGVLDSTWGGTLADMVRFVQEYAIVRREGLIEKVPTLGALLVETLQGLAERFPELMYNVRGYGLYQGFSMRTPGLKQTLIQRARDREKLLLLGAGADTIRLRPHLHVSEEDIHTLGAMLERLLTELS